MNTKRKKNILLVDDDPFLQALYRKTLEREGYNILTAHDGLAALEKLPENPDLVVLDLMLPKLDGMKVLEAIRADNRHKDLPVLILSNGYLPEVAQKAMEAGATAGLMKSECSPKQLVKMIRDTLKAALQPAVEEGKQSAARNSWIPSLLRGKAGAPEMQSNAKTAEPAFAETEFDSDQPDISPEFQNELLKNWPTEISMIRGICLRYAKSIDGPESEDQLKEIYRRLRLLSVRAAMAEWFRVGQLSSAVEAMLFEQGFRTDKTMSQSVIQTMFQAVDCLEHLFKGGRTTSIQNTQNIRILLVDDDPVSNRANELALKRLKIDTGCAGDGEAAFALLEKNPFDLILLDIEMPGLNGFEVCKKIRKLPHCKETPVIFLTIRDDFQSRAQSVLCGGNSLITKPISPLELIVKALIFLLRPHAGKPSNEPQAHAATPVAQTAAHTPISSAPADPAKNAGQTKELQATQAAVDEKVKALTEALAAETKLREKAEQEAAEHARLQRKLENDQAENQKARERLQQMLEEAQQQQQSQGGDGSQPLKMDGRTRALQAVRDFVEDKSRKLTAKLAEQTDRSKCAQDQAAECAKRMGEFESSLAAVRKAKENLLQELETTRNSAQRTELEAALAENQKSQSSLVQKIEETWQEFEAHQQDALSGEPLVEEQIKELEASRAAVEEKVNALAEELASVTKRSENAEQQAAEISQRRKTLEAELAASNQTQAELRAQLAEQQKKLDAQAQAHQAELGQLAGRTKELELTRATVEEKVAALTKTLEAEAKRSESAEQQAADMDGRRSALEAELIASKQAQAKLREQLAEQQKQLDVQTQTHLAELGNLAGRTKELEAGRTDVEERVKALTQALELETKRSHSAEQQAAETTQRRSALEAELAASNQAQAQLRAQLAEQQQKLDAQVQAHHVELGNLTERTMELETNRAAVEEKVKNLTQALTAENKRSETAEQQAVEISKRRNALEAELAASNEAQAQLRAQLTEQQQQLQARLQSGDIEFKKLAERTKELEASHALVEEKVKTLTQALAAETKRSESAEHQATEITQRRATLEAELAASNQAQAKLRTQIAEQQKQLDAQVQTYHTELGNLAGRTKELEANRAAVDEKVKSLTKALAAEAKRSENAERQAADIKQRRDVLEADLAASNQAQTQLRAQLAEQQQKLAAQVQTGQAELGKLSERTQELEAIRAALEEKIKSLTQALAAETKRAEIAEQKAAEINQRRNALEAELAASNHAQAQLRAQVAELQQQLTAQVQAHQVEVSQTAGRTKELEAGRAAVEEQVKSLKQALAAETKRSEIAERQAADIKQRRDALEAELAASGQAQTELRAQLAEQQRQLAVQVQTGNAEFGKLAARTKELETSRAAVEEKVKSLTQALAAETKRVENAEQQAADTDKRRSALEAELAAGNQAQAKLRSQIEEQKQQLNLVSAELEGFRRCAQDEALRHAQMAAQIAGSEKTLAELGVQLDTARALASSREDAINALNIELQKHRDAHEKLDVSLQGELAQRHDLESRIQHIQVQLDETSGQLAQKCTAEQGWLARESELQNRLRSQQEDLAKAKAALASQEVELKNTRIRVEESQILQTVLCAKVQALTDQAQSATKVAQELEVKAARTANADKHLAGLRYAVLDASRLSAKLQLERFQIERQNLDTMRKLVSSLAQTPLSMAQRGMLAEVQNSMDGLDNIRSVAVQTAACPIEMPNFQPSEFCVAEVVESAFGVVRKAAKAANVKVHASVSDTTSGRLIGYAEHVHQLITLLAVSPLTIMPGINACDLRVEVKPGSAKSAEMTLRIALSADNPQDLLSHLNSVTVAALTPQAASLAEADFGLAAGWQLALAMGAQPAIGAAGANEAGLVLSLPLEIGVGSPGEKTPVKASSLNTNGNGGSQLNRKAKANAQKVDESCAVTE